MAFPRLHTRVTEAFHLSALLCAHIGLTSAMSCGSRPHSSRDLSLVEPQMEPYSVF